MNLQHHFLIAMPGLADMLFRHSVVYICEHNANGAMGIVINKVLENMTVEEVLEQLEIDPQPRDTQPKDSRMRLDKPVFVGGPLGNDRGFILHSKAVMFKSSVQIADNTIVSTSRDVLETLGTDDQPGDVLVALGYASWSKGQLEREILHNHWLTSPADNKILFNTPVHLRWQQAARLLGVDIQTMPVLAGHA